MDIVAEFKYAFGSLEDVRKGRLESLPVARSLMELEPDFETSGIIVPKVIGVYQRRETVLQGEEKEHETEIRAIIKAFDKLTELFSQTTQAREGLEYIAGSLVCVGYEPKQIPEDIVRDYFRSDGRIKTCNWRDIPDFSEKLTYKIYELAGNLKDRGFDSPELFFGAGREEFLKIMSDGECSLRRQAEAYGLTVEEAAFLRMMRKMKRVLEDRDSELITNPLLTSIFSKFLRHKK